MFTSSEAVSAAILIIDWMSSTKISQTFWLMPRCHPQMQPRRDPPSLLYFDNVKLPATFPFKNDIQVLKEAQGGRHMGVSQLLSLPRPSPCLSYSAGSCASISVVSQSWAAYEYLNRHGQTPKLDILFANVE